MNENLNLTIITVSFNLKTTIIILSEHYALVNLWTNTSYMKTCSELNISFCVSSIRKVERGRERNHLYRVYFGGKEKEMKKRQKDILQQRLKETRKRTGTERREKLKKRQKGGEHQITKPNRNRWRSFTTNVLIVI